MTDPVRGRGRDRSIADLKRRAHTGRTVRASARADLPVHDRNVGALLLLRDALAARALHDEISAAGRSFRQRGRPPRRQARARKHLRAARRATAVVADLGPLYRPRLFHADFRRATRRPRARPAPYRRHRRRPDGDRPFHDGGRAAFSVRAAGADPRLGCFKPNISTQVGGLYAPGDHRRDRAYSIFYVGINVGAFLAPLVCGTLGEEVGWHYGFAAAGVGMCIGL